MIDIEAVWAALDAEPATAPGVLMRRVAHAAFDVHLIQERPSRLLGLLVKCNDGPGARWKELRASRGLDIRIDVRPGHDATLMLTERDSSFHDVFSALVSDLIRCLDALSARPPDGRALTLDFLASRITRWQAALQANRDGLSAERAAGLFGELTMMLALVDAGVSPNHVVDRWTGPEQAIQDFQFDEVTLEVKTTRQTQPVHVRISSERQLDTSTLSRLVLAHYALDERSDGGGSTLPQVVGRARSALSLGHAGAALEEKLLNYGYLDLHAPRYSERSYVIRAAHYFDVRDPMPRIVEADLPIGVGKVSYDLALSACGPYSIAWDEVAAIFEGGHP
ncbi:PD-(D/E)XK motif protein [Geodermatophilus sp. SYSU D01045]